jgi:hypothetical protein
MGWVAYALERADLVWERYGRRDGISGEPPSSIFKQNFFVCQVDERTGARQVELLGEDKVLWELDYPHPDTVWPFAQEAASAAFLDAGLSERQIAMVTHENSEAVFRWTSAQGDGSGSDG